MKRTIVKPNTVPAWRVGDVLESDGIRWRVIQLVGVDVLLWATSTSERRTWNTTVDQLPEKVA